MTATEPGVESEAGGTDADAAFASARARVYGLLAAAFDGDVDALTAAMERGAFDRLADAFPVDVDVDPLTRTDLGREALAVGYDNLFVVPGPHYVPPFASAHATDPSGSFDSDSPYHASGDAGELLGGPAATAARRHAAFGVDPERGDGIPDHLAAEFEFMRALCEREAQLRADADAPTELAAVCDAQRATLDCLGWLDAFDEAVRREDAAEGVFGALATFARTFAAWDARAGDADAPDEDNRP